MGAGLNINPGLDTSFRNAIISQAKRVYPNGMLGYIPMAAVESLSRRKASKLDCDLAAIRTRVNFRARLDTSKEFRLRFERNIASIFPPYPIEAVGCLGGRPTYLETIARDLKESLDDVKWVIGGYGMWAVETYFALCRYRGFLDFDTFKWLR